MKDQFNGERKKRKGRKEKKSKEREGKSRGRGGKGKITQDTHTDLQKEFIQSVDHLFATSFLGVIKSYHSGLPLL